MKIILPYIQELERIRKDFELNCPDFPKNKCELAARAIREDLGLKEVAGFYLPNNEFHVWNYDKKHKLYVDITLDQFDNKYDGINFLNEETDILNKNFFATYIQRRRKIHSRYYSIAFGPHFSYFL